MPARRDHEPEDQTVQAHRLWDRPAPARLKPAAMQWMRPLRRVDTIGVFESWRPRRGEMRRLAAKVVRFFSAKAGETLIPIGRDQLLSLWNLEQAWSLRGHSLKRAVAHLSPPKMKSSRLFSGGELSSDIVRLQQVQRSLNISHLSPDGRAPTNGQTDHRMG